MSKKIVAIGGGAMNQNEPIVKEIINLSEKSNPTFLYLAHSIPNSIPMQNRLYERVKKLLNEKYNCKCLFLNSNDIIDGVFAKEIVNEADVIYEEGGNTLTMIDIWKKYEFDKVLKDAYESGKVMSGVSAGANCWFERCSSDSYKIMYGRQEPFIDLECLGFLEGFFVPHCNEFDRISSAKEFLKNNDMVGFFLSNFSALEIVDDKYKVITKDDYTIINENDKKIVKPYALKGYYLDNAYYENKLSLDNEYKEVKSLVKKM